MRLARTYFECAIILSAPIPPVLLRLFLLPFASFRFSSLRFSSLRFSVSLRLMASNGRVFVLRCYSFALCRIAGHSSIRPMAGPHYTMRGQAARLFGKLLFRFFSIVQTSFFDVLECVLAIPPYGVLHYSLLRYHTVPSLEFLFRPCEQNFHPLVFSPSSHLLSILSFALVLTALSILLSIPPVSSLHPSQSCQPKELLHCALRPMRRGAHLYRLKRDVSSRFLHRL